jgi:NAD(P)-dependent dehydrogenase (short-subunit alcohol dehydrogenase family)
MEFRLARTRAANLARQPQRLRGKVALVTGATRGIGLAIAQALAAEGCHLAITGREQASLKKAGQKLEKAGVKVLATPCDVRDPASVASLCRAIHDKFHRLDILINNAGIAHASATIDSLPIDSWLEVIDTNLTGAFLLSHFALPLMKKGGAIVNNLSTASRKAFVGSSAYVASKHGALGLTDTLREELRPRGIRVIALMPGATNTGIWGTLWPEAPRHRMMAPATVATAVVNALSLPVDSTLEELIIRPAAGTL